MSVRSGERENGEAVLASGRWSTNPATFVSVVSGTFVSVIVGHGASGIGVRPVSEGPPHLARARVVSLRHLYLGMRSVPFVPQDKKYRLQ